MSFYMLGALRSENAALLGTYQQQAAASLGGFNCTPLSVNAEHTVVEGDLQPDVIILLEFADKAEFTKWWNSAEYQAVKPLREASSTTLLGVVFEGHVNIAPEADHSMEMGVDHQSDP